jgi:hypothetical protein
MKPTKSEEALPIPEVWRPTLREIVKSFAEGDFLLNRTIAMVSPVAVKTAHHIENSVADYGETLIELPEKTWRSSQYYWTATHWEVLVDLWTAEAGRSDLVLFVDVYEVEAAFCFQVYLVYVP